MADLDPYLSLRELEIERRKRLISRRDASGVRPMEAVG